MATTKEYIEFVCDQIRDTGDVRYRKMFGEYMVYVDDRPVLLVCDSIVYVKMFPELAELMKDADKGIPYEGSKEHYILDIDDRDLSADVIAILKELTPIPTPKKKKAKPAA